MAESTVAPDPSGPAWSRWSPKALPLLGAWAALALGHLALRRLAPPLVVDILPPLWVSAGLLLTELTFGAVTLLGLAALLLPLGRWRARAPGPGARRLADGAAWGVVAAFLLAYGASWSSYLLLGQFADLGSVEFAWVNGSLFLGYVRAMHPRLLLLLPAGALGLAALWVWGTPPLRARLSPRIAQSAFRILSAFLLVCLLGALGIELFHGWATDGVRDPASGVLWPWSRLYEAHREGSAGPFSHAWIGVFHALSPGTSAAPVRPSSTPVLRRPQIPMGPYLSTAGRPPGPRPNVVMVLVDSLRPDHLQVGGALRSEMRTVDRLASESRFFSNARTEASHTDYAAPCPLSSQYPLRSVTVHRYPPSPPYPRVMIYDVLKALGYRTAHVSSQDERWGLMMNFLQTGGLDRFDDARRPDSRSLMWSFRRDDLTLTAALDWLDQPSPQPFFLSINLQNSHFPYVVPPEWPRRFGKPADFVMSLGIYPKDHVEDVRNLYADALDYIDGQIARLIEYLKRRGLWSETVFVLLADHGEAFLEHGFGGHGGRIYEEVMKVPLLFHGPGIAPGQDDRPAELIDVPPSLCHLLGLPPHPAFQGIDLFADAPRERSRFMVVHTPLASQYGVERAGWKVIYDERMKLSALYDLRHDPRETRDVSLEQPSILRELLRQANEWRDLQLEYYQNPRRMATEYAPVRIEAPLPPSK